MSITTYISSKYYTKKQKALWKCCEWTLLSMSSKIHLPSIYIPPQNLKLYFILIMEGWQWVDILMPLILSLIKKREIWSLFFFMYTALQVTMQSLARKKNISSGLCHIRYIDATSQLLLLSFGWTNCQWSSYWGFHFNLYSDFRCLKLHRCYQTPSVYC